VSEAARGTHGDWDVVLETNHAYEAEFAALRLREAGVETRVIDQSYRQEPVPFVRSLSLVRVLVPVDQAEAARSLLAQGPRLPEEAESEET
jgi:Putative prokaryotic signal transducing protein